MIKNLSLCLALSGVAMGAAADTTMVYTSVTGGDREAARVQIRDGRVLLKAGTGNDAVRMLFEEEQDRFVVIDDDQRTYMPFDRETIAQVADMQKRVMTQMEEQLAQLPPEQRERMAKMMQDMGGGMAAAAPKPRRFVRTGEGETIGDRDCEQIEIYSGDRLAARQCVIDIDALDMPDADYRTFVSMQKFMADLAANFAAIQEDVFEFGDPSREEVPVWFEHYSRQAATTRGELTDLSTEPLDAAIFTVPEGYRKEQLPSLDEF